MLDQRSTAQTETNRFCLSVKKHVNVGIMIRSVITPDYNILLHYIQIHLFFFQSPRESMQIFNQLKNWIANFLDHNKDMTASEIGHNELVEQVLVVNVAVVSYQNISKLVFNPSRR